MSIEQHKDVESGEANRLQYLQEPFIQQGEAAAANKEVGSDKSVENGSIGMVLLSTFVAVCGSFSFGTCVGYSAPTQATIRKDLNLSLAEFSMFGSLVNHWSNAWFYNKWPGHGFHWQESGHESFNRILHYRMVSCLLLQGFLLT